MAWAAAASSMRFISFEGMIMKLSPAAQRRIARAIPYVTIAIAALMAAALTYTIIQ